MLHCTHSQELSEVFERCSESSYDLCLYSSRDAGDAVGEVVQSECLGVHAQSLEV